MNARKYLNELKRLDTIIRQKLASVEDLRGMLTSIKSMDYSADRVQTSTEPCATFERMIQRIIDAEADINDHIDYYADRKMDISDEIQQLADERYIETLYRVYVEFETLNAAAIDMGYSYGHICRIHGEALQQFQAFLDSRENVSKCEQM
jgi:hypothetical protein